MGAEALSNRYFNHASWEVVSDRVDFSEIDSVKSVVESDAPWFWGVEQPEPPLTPVNTPANRLRYILHVIKAIPRPLINEEISRWQENKATTGKLETAGQNNQKRLIHKQPNVRAIDAYRIPEVKLDVLSSLSYVGDPVIATIDTIEKWRQEKTALEISKRNSELAHAAFELTLFGVNSNNFTGLVKKTFEEHQA